MKYILLCLGLGLSACGTKPVGSNSDWADVPKPPPIQNPLSQRKLASDEEYLGQSYQRAFGEKNYIDRLLMIRKLIGVLHTSMEEKGHPRKNILRKFQSDLDRQIAFLQRVETDQKGLTNSWLPAAGSYQYGAKLRALETIKFSSDVMAQLETYMAATQVMDEATYEQNFYYSLMRTALHSLADDLQKRESLPADGLVRAQLSYSDYLASLARTHLHKVFEDKKSRPLVKRLNAFFRQVQATRSLGEAKTLSTSTEMAFARATLANADFTKSSDIDGSRDDMDNKISTYFGLEMIKYICGQMN